MRYNVLLSSIIGESMPYRNAFHNIVERYPIKLKEIFMNRSYLTEFLFPCFFARFPDFPVQVNSINSLIPSKNKKLRTIKKPQIPTSYLIPPLPIAKKNYSGYHKSKIDSQILSPIH
jgi:hypothetical protein